MPSESDGGGAEEQIKRVLVNFNFENLARRGEVSSEASAFEREEVALAKTSHWPRCIALDPIQLVNIS